MLRSSFVLPSHVRSARPLLRTLSTAVHTTTATSPRTPPSQSSAPSKQTDFPHLFTPLNLGNGIVLPNRALMGSMHTGLEHHSLPNMVAKYVLGHDESSSSHHPLDRLAAYFRARAEGGVGLMVTGGIAPNAAGWTGPFGSRLCHEADVEPHRLVTEAVHDVSVPIVTSSVDSSNNPDGLTSVPARIVLQILHTGRYGYHPLAQSASATKSPISPFPARALSTAGVASTVSDFTHTATLAQQAGYDGVEIMGSEGYLLHQFLDGGGHTNQRTDEYGRTSLADRARMPLEIVRATRQAVGPDFLLLFRLSLLDLMPATAGLTLDESVQVAEWLKEAGATMITTGIGWHEARVPTISTSVPRGSFAFATQIMRDRQRERQQDQSNSDDTGSSSDPSLPPFLPLVATNRINDPQTAEDILRDGRVDMVSLARPFLADPDWVLKARTGKVDEINTCIGCNQACLDHVFVGKVASCLVNPVACHETKLKFQTLPQTDCQRIGVVGAGPAGCAFAISAARQGHEVTLYDKDCVIGGQFNMAKRIPGKEEFHETLRYFRTMLKKHNVLVKLGQVVTTSDMEGNAHDKWIVATGVLPRDPKIPGQDHPNVLSYIDVLKHKRPVGKKVAVIGAGGIGFDVSEYLLHYDDRKGDISAADVDPTDFWKEWGIDVDLQTRGGLVPPSNPPVGPDAREIVLLQRKKSKLGAGLGKTTGWIHRATLTKSGRVEMVNGVQYEKIDENGHLHILQDGTPRILEVDNIVVCAGQVEYRDLDPPEKKGGAESKNNIFTIGGAYAAGELDAKRAIDMGTRLALKIHEEGVVPGHHVFSADVGVEEKLFNFLKRFMK